MAHHTEVHTLRSACFALAASLLIACMPADPSAEEDQDAAAGSAGSAGGGGNGTQDAAVDVVEELQSPEPLRLVSWNAHNVYDNISANCGSYCPYEETVSLSDYQEKVSDIAATLAKLAGDVVILQEVENPAVLDKIATSSALSSLNYKHRHLEFGNDPRGINIALLSRYPVDSVISHKKDQFTQMDNPGEIYRYTRDALEIHMTYRGKHVVIFGVHFKAKLDPDDPEKRLAEAQHVRALADNTLQNYPTAYVWILGDFNDDEGTPPVNAVQKGRNGPNFVDAMMSLSAGDRYSYIYSGDKILIDHLFASPNAAARLQSGTVKIDHTSSVPSDHDPIAATYLVP